jgi:hypothetical protein
VVYFQGLRRIKAGHVFSVGFRADWDRALGVWLVVMFDFGFWRMSFAFTKSEPQFTK